MTIFSDDQSIGKKKILLVAQQSSAHHFDGLHDNLRARGWQVKSETLQQTAPVHVSNQMTIEADVILHTDSNTLNASNMHAQAREYKTPTALLMDGTLEYANTFLNPHVGANFLRPAPADEVFALGQHDSEILNALGNHAFATGLPRVEGIDERVHQYRFKRNKPLGLLIATANQAWFTRGGRARLVDSLVAIRDAAALRSIPVHWRISHEIAIEIGVRVDIKCLSSSLAQSLAVITSASTLAFESMSASIPTAILHPHPWPLWIPSPLTYTGTSKEGWADDQCAMLALKGQDIAANTAAQRSINEALNNRSAVRTDSAHILLDELMSVNTERNHLQQQILKRCVSTHAIPNITDCLDLTLANNLSCEDNCFSANEEYTQNLKPLGGVIEAFQSLRAKGARRIAIAHDSRPLPDLQWLSEHRPSHLAGFVVTKPTTQDHVLFGVKAVQINRMHKELQPDAILLVDPECDPSILAAVLWNTPARVQRVKHTSEDPQFNSVSETISIAKQLVEHNEVRTTLAPGICEGASTVPLSEIFSDHRPAMILLRGDELDFEIYHRARAWREAGTVVRSLRWDVAELSAPERFGFLVRSFGDSPFAIYGGGLHTQRLLMYGDPPRLPNLIIDDECEDGRIISGVPVVQPNAPLIDQICEIVISSRAHEPQIWERTSSMRKKGIVVHKLYDHCTLDSESAVEASS